MAKTKDTLTASDFVSYGMTSCPTLAQLRQLGTEDIEVLIYIPNGSGITPSVTETFYGSEIYWCMSPDNENWYIYKNNDWVSVTLENFVSYEFTKDEINAIPQAKLNSMFNTDKIIYFKAALISNVSGYKPAITSIAATSLTSYQQGESIIYSKESFSINTQAWISITKLTCTYTKPENTSIFVLFSIDGGEYWQTLDSGSWAYVALSNIFKDGIPIENIASITSDIWDKFVMKAHLDVAIGIKNNNDSATPIVKSLIFDYVQYDPSTESNLIIVETPKTNYEMKVIEDGVYVDKPAEGIGFDDFGSLNYWYTTPNFLHLRVFPLGTLIGSRQTNLYRCKLRNTFIDRDCKVTLSCRVNGVLITPHSSGKYGVVEDSIYEEEKTKVEFSNSGAYFSYPLEIVLRKEESKNFYFRITPTVTTVGKVQAEVIATYVEYLQSS